MAANDETIESALIARVLAGEHNAYRELILRYQDRVFTLFMRQVGERSAARDLTQETFLRAFRNLGGYRGKKRFSVGLIRTALAVANSYFSSRRWRSHAFSRTDKENQRAAEEAALDEGLGRLRTGIGLLKPKLRDVLVLFALERRSYEETAAILDISTATVRARLNAARSRLRRYVFARQP